MNNIKLTVLGSGTMVPTKERNPAGFLVEFGNQKILLDCGHGVIRRMTDYNIKWQSLDYVFISHFHTDHFGDAFNLVHTRWVDDNYNQRENKKLVFIGPKGIQQRFKLWRQIYWREKGESYPLEFLEGERRLNIGTGEIATFAVKHVRYFQSIGIILKYQGKKIVYTGDIGSQNEIKELAKIVANVDLLITEASYLHPTPNHYSILQVEELAKLAGVKKVLVVHIRPQLVAAVKEACRKNSNWIMGEDGLKLEI